MVGGGREWGGMRATIHLKAEISHTATVLSTIATHVYSYKEAYLNSKHQILFRSSIHVVVLARVVLLLCHRSNWPL
eukprot:COSAG01_NODE_71318_length_256_cov_0.662420_1_plen_75_part_01